ncbi:ABC transporter ATP-binding protein [Salipaludibacillus aurantiacus]|uniref:Energy-coupling factor transport system ATP-binding protein n=1 Tax=Salipaludibacillus aurantiacus TaxID=1601833 RepID=A0A1H9TT41_9BACI|nr:ABC transporter ATP-binding protein [Salipaludibacillus aurantiacus]SES00218.1 energy-coupling factor transport system ATP-binding protein [Salipaludibacillus aurantiacus]
MKKRLPNQIPAVQKQPALIRTENLSFDYEKKQSEPLINDVSFSLEEGEVTLLTGASGSGKSTISLCLNGLYPEAVEGYAEGTVYYRGEDISRFEKGVLNQKIGIVFQDPESQFCMVTVENELAFTMENLKVPRKVMAERMDAVLEVTGLTEVKYRAIHELSGGQKQKVALASVLLMEPELLILDEPTANLDPVSSLEFIQLVTKLQQERKMAVLVIEHQLDDWMPYIHRVLALNKHGKLIADGPRDNVFTEYKETLTEEGIHLPKAIQKNTQKLGGQTPQFLEPALSISNLSFKRKDRTILEDLTMTLHKGEFVAVAGENGAGKSTLLQLMAGILSPHKGTITFQDAPLKKWREEELRKHMGFVFQNPEHQFITDTVYDELSFGMKLNGTPEEEMKEKVTELLGHFQLEGHRWNNPFSLSGGQKRRLSVATMLDETPDVLLFDEPTFGQDAKTTDELMSIVLDLKAKGTTIVFVTHDMDLIDQYCETVFVLDKGNLAFSGTPEQLWDKESLLKQARLRLPYRVRQLKEEGDVYDLVR